MQEVKEVIAGLSLIYLFQEVFWTLAQPKLKDGKYVTTWVNKLFNRKPFNCVTCLCFWVTFLMFLFTGNIFILSLSLLYHVLTRLLNRL